MAEHREYAVSAMLSPPILTRLMVLRPPPVPSFLPGYCLSYLTLSPHILYPPEEYASNGRFDPASSHPVQRVPSRPKYHPRRISPSPPNGNGLILVFQRSKLFGNGETSNHFPPSTLFAFRCSEMRDSIFVSPYFHLCIVSVASACAVAV